MSLPKSSPQKSTLQERAQTAWQIIQARPQLSHGLAFFAGVLTLWLGMGLWQWSRSGSDGFGPYERWTDPKVKQNQAELLNRQVLLPGFNANAHAVEKGESYWSVASDAGINIDSLIGVNPDMQHLEAYIGRPLLVVNKRGSLHVVQKGDSARSIARDYGVELKALREANGLGWFGVRQGRLLFVPGAAPRQMTPEMRTLVDRRNLLRSPLAGKYTSLVGTRSDPFTGSAKHHNGVDIKAPFNEWVGAAGDGTVISAGWAGGYGKTVRIQHVDGYETLYGHLNVILVSPSAKVKQHQFIGRVGATGRTTGPHLHFTVTKNGKIQDPLKFLW